jgi:hypothetical protein
MLGFCDYQQFLPSSKEAHLELNLVVVVDSALDSVPLEVTNSKIFQLCQ